ncbi:hypothetical protein [Rathayibacter festucae]|uniref:DUF998 domain-containing protein n=1 Tax=Rathayibacter festucae DSM 15932 TaxID=1328866 RepID=A0A3Q9UUM4_9MICO|nr:hypothetical protein [Rathayibacter festucae]AZZ50929.1 hypothetical protein C1I64_01930 [Rathayibacter festucae DSM 15932]
MHSPDALRADGTVSSLRTYRYVRVSLVAAVLFLGIGVTWHLATLGPLRSISAAYYTPVRSIFVGSLFAVAVGLVVLAGRSLRRTLLVIAGFTAPVIALVPAPVPSDELELLTGTGCPAGVARCVAPGTADAIAVGILAYLVVAAAALVASLAFLAVDRALDRGAWLRAGGAAVLLTALAVFSTTPVFADLGHYAAAALFFLLIAAVAGIHAHAVRSQGVRGPGSLRAYSLAYSALAALLAAVDAAAIVLLLTGRASAVFGEQWLLIVEAVALALFTAFWILQTVENWRDPDAAAH